MLFDGVRVLLSEERCREVAFCCLLVMLVSGPWCSLPAANERLEDCGSISRDNPATIKRNEPNFQWIPTVGSKIREYRA